MIVSISYSLLALNEYDRAYCYRTIRQIVQGQSISLTCFNERKRSEEKMDFKCSAHDKQSFSHSLSLDS